MSCIYLQSKVNRLIGNLYYLEKGLNINEVIELEEDSEFLDEVLLFIIEDCKGIDIYQGWLAPKPLGLGLKIPIQGLVNAERAGAICELSGYSPSLGIHIAEISLSFLSYGETWFLIRK